MLGDSFQLEKDKILIEYKTSDSFELKKDIRHGWPPRVLCMLVPVQIELSESLKLEEMLCSSYCCNIHLGQCK